MRAEVSSALRAALRAGLVFAATLTGGALLIVILWMAFGDTIKTAREEYIIKLARETLMQTQHNNAPVDALFFSAQSVDLPSARIIAVACVNHSLIIRGAAKQGYGGGIEFVMSFIGENIGGIRIIRHRETPGIADFLDSRDGGKKALDGIAGATITAAAMTKAVAEMRKWQKRKTPADIAPLNGEVHTDVCVVGGG